jgi:hypothetical protein
MKTLFLVWVLLGSVCSAEVVGPVVTSASAVGGVGFIAGKLDGKTDRPLGISLQNGNVISSTITDPEGHWAIVIRHLSNQFSVQSWELSRGLERSVEVHGELSR